LRLRCSPSKEGKRKSCNQFFSFHSRPFLKKKFNTLFRASQQN
jgi:hypothetical protein